MKLWEFTADDGLPLVDPESLPDSSVKQVINMAPLGPGRVCLAGAFGRTWLAIAAFDPQAKKTVKVFHEARNAPEAKALDQWMRTTVAFEPVRMFTLTGERGASRVLIGRGCIDHWVESHPLVVDPETLKVEVMKEVVYNINLVNAQVRDGVLYYLGDGLPDNRHLVTIAFPGTEKKSVMTNLPHGRVTLDGDSFFHVTTDSEGWWHGSLAKKEVRRVGFMAPGNVNFMGSSAHYGVLVQQTSKVDQKNPTARQSNTLYQVAVSPMKKTK
jgi:hypothetical protein